MDTRGALAARRAVFMRPHFKQRRRKKSPQRCRSEFHFKVHYPEQNPPGAIDDITRVLVYVGILGEAEQQ